MKTLSLLRWFSQIKCFTWDYMVNIPSPFSIVVPRHSNLKFGLDIADQLFPAASNQSKCMVGFLLAVKNKQHSPSKVGQDADFGIFSVLNGKSLLYSFNVLFIGWVVAITTGTSDARFSV
jgi:hypothetical protein